MRLAGTADLPLHSGPVPAWLMSRMKHLAKHILAIVVDEYGTSEVIKRMSDPFWFQAFGCVLGFDWHSSGLTTVVVGAIRDSISLTHHGVAVVGGKGKAATGVTEKITAIPLDDRIKLALVRASRLSAKVDNAVVQDGYTLYHHAIIFNERGEWSVVQQGMNVSEHYARRYHWLGENLRSFVENPHTAIIGDRTERYVLDLTSDKNRELRKVSVDLVKESPTKLVSMFNLVVRRQATLDNVSLDVMDRLPRHLSMPRRIDWKVIKKAYDIQPRDYEELVEVRGLGPGTIRALALVSALIYGHDIDWRDPVKYSFAHGGKDGVPYPVERRRMDKVIGFLRDVVESSQLDREEKKQALRRLYLLERRMYEDEQETKTGT